MQKATPAKHLVEPPEQLALPLEEPTPPSAEAKDVRPMGVWRTLETKSRASAKERWAKVMREVAYDARD